jgi:hypothetical protein
MANTFESGAAVASGYYLNLGDWSVEPVAADGERLPAGKGAWKRVPTIGALAVVPVMGALFLVFLPLIGFVLAIRALAQPLLRAFHAQAADLAATVSPGWQPGEAHFTGKREDKASVEAQGPPADAKLDALEKEIEARRSRS